MSTINQFGWISQQNYDGEVHFNIWKMDESRFICIDEEISSFDIMKNQWLKWDMNKVKLPEPATAVSAYDASSKQVYILGRDGMLIFDTGKITRHHCAISNVLEPTLFCVDSICHSIGGWYSNNHQIWNNETKQFQQVHTFSEYPGGFGSFGLIHAKKRKEIFLFGGYDMTDGKRLDVIYKYSLSTKTWGKLDTKLPHKMNYFGCVITMDEQYIIILGGFTMECGATWDDKIWVLSLKSMSFRECKIKLPFIGKCAAIIMQNKNENDLLVHGWIRKDINKYNMNIPFALISLIAIWHSTEYVHVLNANLKENGAHWKINVDKIIDMKK